jgi:type IV secretion system protein VirD4
LTAPGDEFIAYLKKMADNPQVGYGVPREAATFLLSMEPRERANVMSTVHQNVTFLASPPMSAMFEGKGRAIDVREWKFGGQSIYLCLPALRLHRHARFFRIFVNAVLLAVERGSAKRPRSSVPNVPALMILDEMHVLGRMQALETAAGLVAGYGLRIWSIWQDFAQLTSIYKDRWETFLGNASVLQAFGLNDMTTLKYISERLGISPIVQISQGEISTLQAATGFTGVNKSLQSGPLLAPEEVAYFFSRQARSLLVSYPGVDPIFLKRVEFFEHPAFKTYWRKHE